MRKFIIISAALTLLLSGCEANTDFVFDTPFVSIADKSKLQTSQMIDKEANNLLSELCISLVASDNKFQNPVTVEYELVVGDGLKEGVDFKLQSSTASPVTFTPGTYDMPVRIIWMKNPAFDPKKDNRLEVRLSGCSLPDAHIGYLGPNSKRKSFIFIKQ